MSRSLIRDDTGWGVNAAAAQPGRRNGPAGLGEVVGKTAHTTELHTSRAPCALATAPAISACRDGGAHEECGEDRKDEDGNEVGAHDAMVPPDDTAGRSDPAGEHCDPVTIGRSREIPRLNLPAAMDDRTAATRMAAIANLPMGWVIEDSTMDRSGLDGQ